MRQTINTDTADPEVMGLFAEALANMSSMGAHLLAAGHPPESLACYDLDPCI